MSASTLAAPVATRRTVWRHGLVAAVIATAATTTIAAVAAAAGVGFADHTGASIPLLGFAEVTVVLALIGVALAAILDRKARRPRQTFLRTTIGLTMASFVPDLISGFDVASAITLIALHVVAAAIVIPTLAARLAESKEH